MTWVGNKVGGGGLITMGWTHLAPNSPILISQIQRRRTAVALSTSHYSRLFLISLT